MVLADTTKSSKRRKPLSPGRKRALRKQTWQKRRRKALGLVGRVIVNIVIGLILVVFALRFIDPPTNYLMVREQIKLGSIKNEWVSLSGMSPYTARSAVAAEDADYCEHLGFDFAAIRAALSDESRQRGGSTISQQTAKNVFLWPDRSWLRKGLEAGFTVLIELLWGKERIIEVYLNVAEFDEGVFGVASASRHYFGVSAAQLSPTQAARLMAILPAPRTRSAIRPGPFTRWRTGQIIAGAKTISIDGRAACFQ